MVDEFLGLAYFYEKKLPVTIFRLFNTVGPRQTGRYGMVIPRFVQQAKNGEPITVYADGQQSRCFMHVSDAVRAIYDLSIKPEAEGEVFNIGSTEETTVLELAQKVLCQVRGDDNIPPEDDPLISFIPYEDAYTEGFEDMRRRVPDISKIGKLTGWAPSLKLDDILRDIVVE
jgi:UDP-glucose 4-epimerase